MNFDIKKLEEKILDFWEKHNIFQQTLKKDKTKKSFIFFEGPPTANAKPGIHHFIGRAFKDLFNRYKTMQGYFVLRKAGWDTHGLPVEIEVEKELGLKNKKGIEKYGISKFNVKAKKSVWKYKDEWERFTKRIGFWLDLDKPYITYNKDYIETLWWIIKQIYKKGLFYKGHKVLPWCPRCGTALSSHEVAQGYQNIKEDSVYVKFKLNPKQKIGNFITDKHTYILAWTTTPWTLPGNVALAINENIDYVIVEWKGEKLILAESLIEKVFADPKISQPKQDSKSTAVKVNMPTSEAKLKGKDLVGLEYKPLFDIPAFKSGRSYKIYPADFVTTDEGTGVVHTAVMYGEDDYELGKKVGLPQHHTVDEEGKFTKDVPGFSGQFVKDAEPGIIKYLKDKNLLFKVEPYTHDYPFCWRCRAPLLYYAKDSWFVAMSKLRNQLLKNNKKINWVPAHLKEGRFGEFLREVKDWAFSRERFWGTPLPIWQCQGKCDEYLVIGSYEEIHKNAYRKPNTYYYMRHGFSTKNGPVSIISSLLENDKYPLTKKGREDVEKESQRLKKKDSIDIIISSPFLRTKETAKIVSKILGIDFQIDKRLHEINHGSMCEGKTHYACLPADGRIPRDLNYRFGDGESWMDIRRRTADLLADLNKEHEGKKILLIGHGDPLVILEAIANRKTDKDLLAVLRPDGDEYEKKMREKDYPQKGRVKKLKYIYGPYDELGYIDPHRPYIDNIALLCDGCGGKMIRVKDVADAWFDSGAMPFAQWHYPFENRNMIDKGEQFPADFISEGIDQTRGWFYTLLAVSTLLDKGPAYKNVLSYSHVLDEKGKKMSKSLGNTVDPWDIIDVYGVDSARWYFYSVNSPGDSKLFSTKDVGLRMHGFLTTLWNSLRFFELYKHNDLQGRYVIPKKEPLDRWILSKQNNLFKQVTDSMDKYNPTTASRAIEEFVVNDLSNWWIRRSRSRFQRPENKIELANTLNFLRHILLETSRLLAPFTPFVAEEIYLKLRVKKDPLSVHLNKWPRSSEKLIDNKLEAEMEKVRTVVAGALAQRKEKNIKVRQPLASIKTNVSIAQELEIFVIDEVNVKDIMFVKNQKEDIILDTNLTPDLIMEGYAREITRKIQNMRKESGYRLDKKVFAMWDSDDKEITKAIDQFEGDIKSNTLLNTLERSKSRKQAFDIEKEFEVAPQKKIWLGIWSKG